MAEEAPLPPPRCRCLQVKFIMFMLVAKEKQVLVDSTEVVWPCMLPVLVEAAPLT